MALYAVKYTRTQVITVLVEADTEAEAVAVNTEGWHDKVQAQGQDSDNIVVDNVDTIEWQAPS